MTTTTDALQPRPDFLNLQKLRERILRIVSLGTLIIGVVVAFIAVQNYIKQEEWTLIYFVIGTFSLVIIILVTPQIPYSIKAGLMVGITYLIWPLSIIFSGIIGDARIWFVFASILATIFFGLRAGLGMVGLIGVTFGFMGYGAFSGAIPSTLGWTVEDWASNGMTLLLIDFLTSIAFGTMVNSLNDNLGVLQTTIISEQALAMSLNSEQEILETRTINLERRLRQIRTAAEISRSLGTILDPQELIQHVADLVKDRFDLYYVGVFLNDERNHFSALAAGTGEPGQRMIAQQHKLTIGGSSMVGWATAHGKPRVALDVGEEAIRFRNPHLPLTRSELAIPLSIGNQNIGAVTVQSTESNAYDDDDITVLQTIADSLAIALQNAKLFQQVEESLQEIQQLNQAYTANTWEDVLIQADKLTVTVEQEAIAETSQDAPIKVPLTLRNNQVIGNIMLDGATESWGSDDMEFIEAISNQAALALESARLLDESQRRVLREKSLNELTTRFARTLDFDTLMQTVVKELGQLPNVKEASIHFTPPTDISVEDGEDALADVLLNDNNDGGQA